MAGACPAMARPSSMGHDKGNLRAAAQVQHSQCKSRTTPPRLAQEDHTPIVECAFLAEVRGGEGAWWDAMADVDGMDGMDGLDGLDGSD